MINPFVILHSNPQQAAVELHKDSVPGTYEQAVARLDQIHQNLLRPRRRLTVNSEMLAFVGSEYWMYLYAEALWERCCDVENTHQPYEESFEEVRCHHPQLRWVRIPKFKKAMRMRACRFDDLLRANKRLQALARSGRISDSFNNRDAIDRALSESGFWGVVNTEDVSRSTIQYLCSHFLRYSGGYAYFVRTNHYANRSWNARSGSWWNDYPEISSVPRTMSVNTANEIIMARPRGRQVDRVAQSEDRMHRVNADMLQTTSAQIQEEVREVSSRFDEETWRTISESAHEYLWSGTHAS